MRKYLRNILVIAAIASLTACKVAVVVPAGGSVLSDSGDYNCAAETICVIDVVDLFFDETLTATPEENYVFIEWKKRDRGFFGGSTDPSVRIFTSVLENFSLLAAFLETDEEFYLEPVFADPTDYDPLQVIAASEELLHNTIFDEARDREIPILIYLPEDTGPSPVLLFSHGNGGSRFNSSYLGEHWSDRGYIVVAMQHHGSDETSGGDGSLENVILRIDDVSTVIDQLEIWNEASWYSLEGRLDLDKIGMSGHSFGAVTTQGVSGQVVSYLTEESRDPRIKAALMLSPTPTGVGEPADEYGAVDIPWMLMTGIDDLVAGSSVTVEGRREIYAALPAGGKYELVFFEGVHGTFGNWPLNPAHHAVVLALSTAFWDSWLLGDSSARYWLDGDGALSVLESGDTWRLK